MEGFDNRLWNAGRAGGHAGIVKEPDVGWNHFRRGFFPCGKLTEDAHLGYGQLGGDYYFILLKLFSGRPAIPAGLISTTKSI